MEIRNIKYNVVGTIDCEINHPIHGWIPFTASPEDMEAHGREIYKEIVAGKHGAIAAYTPPPPPTVEELTMMARAQRDGLLAESDKYVLPDRWATMSSTQQAAWSSYRQALRDITTQAGFPTQITWPTKP